MPPSSRTFNIFFRPPKSTGTSGWRGWVDALLRRLGATWRASPVRRSIQTVALGLFLYLFFYVSWPYAETFGPEVLSDKEWIPAELFLWIDPLVGLSTSIAARSVSVALVGTAIILLTSLLVPRGFCGYVCPLGTLIDLADWLIGRHLRWLTLKRDGWWVHLKYYVLAAVLVAAGFGVLLAGFVSAIPVVTRGLAFTLSPLQLGWMRHWGQVRSIGWAEWLSVGLFVLILLAGAMRKRFWCRYVCPSGAVLSLFSVFRLTERKVEATCVECGRCTEVCPFDAINPDYTTRPLDCTWCQTCGGVCRPGAIKFVGRFRRENLRQSVEAEPRRASRRGFLAAALSGTAAALATRSRPAGTENGWLPVRPPGSVPEGEFLDLCVRCGQCFQVCPGPVLHPAGWEAPLEALWTPVAVLTHAGCHQDCNFCTQVCPTGAIRALTIDQKRATSMGLAQIDRRTCLAHAGRQDCRLCVDECDAAGYRAIELRRIELPLDDIPEGVFSDFELDQMSHIDAPFVDAAACVGCGLCEYRCHAALVKQEKLLSRRAVRVVADHADR
jgi:ferredoxin